MKTTLKIFIVSLVVFASVFANVGKVSAQTFTTTCTGGTSTTTINGRVLLNGSSSASVWFEWGPTTSLGSTTAHQTFYSDSNFSQQVYGVRENSTYYYRAMGSNDSGTETGDIHTFSTQCSNVGPTVSISASPSTVKSKGTSTVTWTSQNATSCVANGGTNGWSGNKNLSGSFYTGALTNDTTYSITCTNSSGSSSDSTTITVGSGTVPTVDIRADDLNIDSGDTTNIRWTSDNADTCRASGGRNNWSGSKNTSGTFYTGALRTDTTYEITCTNDAGSDTDSVTVRVDDNNNTPSVTIYANPSSVIYNGTSTITWTSDNATSCTANGGVNGWSGSKNLSGSFYTGNLTYATTFSITCRNSSGSAVDSTTVSVNSVQVNNQPSVSIYADSTNLAFNGATTIRWATTNATACNASSGSVGWAGPKSIGPGAFYTGSLSGTRTYTITCTNDTGSATDFVTVNVRGQVIGVTNVRPQPTSMVLITSSVDRNRPIVPTLDNTNPCPGDEINYSLTYQNIGNASISNLVLRIDLPLEVDYMTSTPGNPNISGNTLIFNLGTLKANGSGTVTVHVRLKNNVYAGTPLNFPAVLSYVDPSGYPQSVNANVSANVCSAALQPASTVVADPSISLGANVFGAGFLPTTILGWLLLLILLLVLILLIRYLLAETRQKRTVVMVDQFGNERTTTTSTNIH